MSKVEAVINVLAQAYGIFEVGQEKLHESLKAIGASDEEIALAEANLDV